MWSTTHQPINSEWNTPMNSQWQWNVVSKQSGWPQTTTPSASVNGFSNSWTPVVAEPQAQSKPKVVQQKAPINPVESSGMSNQQQYYFVPVSNQSSWDYVVPAPMTTMKKIEVPTIAPTPQQQPRSQPEFVNVKSAPNPWGPSTKSPKKNTPPDESSLLAQMEQKKKIEIEDELTQQSLYKTELCRSWTETGACRYGNKCQFAHGKDELRIIMRHPKYKTEICKTFHTQGTCPYGTRCRFIHNPSLRAASLSQQQQQSQAAQVQFPVESEHIPVPAPIVEHSAPSPVVTSPQMIPTSQSTHSIWSAPLLVPSPVSAEVPIDSAFGALSITSTSPSSLDDSPSKRASVGRLPIFQRFTN
jgi:butyrate response factor 1